MRLIIPVLVIISASTINASEKLNKPFNNVPNADCLSVDNPYCLSEEQLKKRDRWKAQWEKLQNALHGAESKLNQPHTPVPSLEESSGKNS
ncbi:MAG TPA: hypothetical protein VFF04_00905 [Candidatus Babeliales bacterium]|nr:hypothetical protein [Candidatus Babeliales bacterium]